MIYIYCGFIDVFIGGVANISAAAEENTQRIEHRQKTEKPITESHLIAY